MPLTKRERYFVLAIVFLLVIFGWLYYAQKNPEQKEGTQLTWTEPMTDKQEDQSKKDTKSPAQPEVYVVDVKGAVLSPGVYEVSEGERVIDVIREAGGFTTKADQKQINLAGLLKDEMVVYVPYQGEKTKQWETSVTAESSGEGKINVNDADVNQLEELPGIGPSKAAAIIAYREENGPFKTAEDLLDVSGIGEKSLEQLKDKVTF